jgi:hypothetical protein
LDVVTAPFHLDLDYTVRCKYDAFHDLQNTNDILLELMEKL